MLSVRLPTSADASNSHSSITVVSILILGGGDTPAIPYEKWSHSPCTRQRCWLDGNGYYHPNEEIRTYWCNVEFHNVVYDFIPISGSRHTTAFKDVKLGDISYWNSCLHHDAAISKSGIFSDVLDVYLVLFRPLIQLSTDSRAILNSAVNRLQH